MAPETFVHISCNPATLARDAVQILAEGFEIDGPVQPLINSHKPRTWKPSRFSSVLKHTNMFKKVG